jgi:hypothetical protein
MAPIAEQLNGRADFSGRSVAMRPGMCRRSFFFLNGIENRFGG